MDSGGGFTTTEAIIVVAVGFGAAILGALIGGGVTAMIEVWRRALETRSAIRVIRFEMIANYGSVQQALEHKRDIYRLQTSAWESHRLAASLICEPTTYAAVHISYGFVPVAQSSMSQLDGGDIETLKHWSNDLQPLVDELGDIEQMSLRRVMWRVLGQHSKEGIDLSSLGDPHFHESDEEAETDEGDHLRFAGATRKVVGKKSDQSEYHK